MNHVVSILFCSITLVLTLALCWAVFPVAALSRAELEATKTPTEAELVDDVEIEGFGSIPVFDMVLHYIDNPPLESDDDEPQVRFQGC